MAFTADQRDALQAAISTGVLTVLFGGRSTTYQSLAEMRSLLAEMERELATTAGTYRTFRLAATRKGV